MKTVVITEMLHKQLKALAKREGRMIQALIEKLLWDALKTRKAA